MNNLKQLMLALHNYEAAGRTTVVSPSDRSGAAVEKAFPPGCVGPGASPEQHLSWIVALLPYLDEEQLAATIDMGKGYSENRPAADTRVGTLLCPSAKEGITSDAVTHYVAMAGLGRDAAERPAGAPGNGFMGYYRLTPLAMIKDGTANTIALLETNVGLGPWARGGRSNVRGFEDADARPGNPSAFGRHSSGMPAAMVDGSVRWVNNAIDAKNLAALITIADGDTCNPNVVP
jgi:prepilin-type processing-associated H-X9-DG protein